MKYNSQQMRKFTADEADEADKVSFEHNHLLNPLNLL